MTHAEVSSDEPAPDLASATLHGVRWIGVSRLIAESVAFMSVVVVAHFVAPADYGRAAVALLVSQIAQGVALQGVGTPIVQFRELATEHVRGAVLLAWGFGIVGTAVVFVGSELIAPSLFGEETAELMALMAPVVLLVSLTAIPIARLQRRLEFRRLAIVDIVSSVAGATVAICAAIAGLDGEAIVLGGVGHGALRARDPAGDRAA